MYMHVCLPHLERVPWSGPSQRMERRDDHFAHRCQLYRPGRGTCRAYTYAMYKGVSAYCRLWDCSPYNITTIYLMVKG